MPDERYAEYCASSDFIREHIFPGGHLPSMAAMTARASRACLTAVRLRDIGPDYAITLRAWRRAWMQRWADIHALGYPDHFMRKCAPALRATFPPLYSPAAAPRPTDCVLCRAGAAQTGCVGVQVAVLFCVLRGRLRLPLHPRLSDRVAAR